MSNLTVRVLVAIVAIPLILFLSMTGGYPFFAFIAIVSAISLHEFYGLGRAKGFSPQVIPGLLFGFCINAVFLHARLSFDLLGALDRHNIAIPFPSMAQAFLILFLLFVPAIFLIELFRNKPQALANIAVTIAGVCYVSIFFGALIGIRELFIPADFPVYAHFQVAGMAVTREIEDTIYRWGGATIISVFVSIWMCDSAAYFAGRGFGKHKLFPRVSPNKTWEGAIAGFIAAVATFLVAREVALPYLSIVSAGVCGAIVGILGQLGDLAESLLKRDAGVKDSSSLIPGHGGALDRFDSLIFVSPVIFFYLDFVLF